MELWTNNGQLFPIDSVLWQTHSVFISFMAYLNLIVIFMVLFANASCYISCNSIFTMLTIYLQIYFIFRSHYCNISQFYGVWRNQFLESHSIGSELDSFQKILPSAGLFSINTLKVLILMYWVAELGKTPKGNRFCIL